MKTDIELIVSTSTNLLRWASYQSKINIVKPVLLNIGDVINEVIVIETPFIFKKDIRIITDVPEELITLFDKEQFGIVIRNLISNAVKFSYPKGQIDIKARLLDETIELTVEDYGIGMPNDILNNLFVVSEKTTRLGTEDEKGTGLGLLLIKNYIEENGGTIFITSIDGKGTCITLILPNA